MLHAMLSTKLVWKCILYHRKTHMNLCSRDKKILYQREKDILYRKKYMWHVCFFPSILINNIENNTLLKFLALEHIPDTKLLWLEIRAIGEFSGDASRSRPRAPVGPKWLVAIHFPRRASIRERAWARTWRRPGAEKAQIRWSVLIGANVPGRDGTMNKRRCRGDLVAGAALTSLV